MKKAMKVLGILLVLLLLAAPLKLTGYAAPYDDGFDAGYNAGYDSGYWDAFCGDYHMSYDDSATGTSQYRNGYKEGYAQGYEAGWETGMEDLSMEEEPETEDEPGDGGGCTNEVNIINEQPINVNNEHTIIINNEHTINIINEQTAIAGPGSAHGTGCGCGQADESWEDEIPGDEIPDEGQEPAEEVSYTPNSGWTMLFDFILECILKCIKAALGLFSLDIHTDSSFSWDITDNMNLTINGGLCFGLR